MHGYGIVHIPPVTRPTKGMCILSIACKFAYCVSELGALINYPSRVIVVSSPDSNLGEGIESGEFGPFAWLGWYWAHASVAVLK